MAALATTGSVAAAASVTDDLEKAQACAITALGGVLCAAASGGTRTADALRSLAASLVAAAAAVRADIDVKISLCVVRHEELRVRLVRAPLPPEVVAVSLRRRASLTPLSQALAPLLNLT